VSPDLGMRRRKRRGRGAGYQWPLPPIPPWLAFALTAASVIVTAPAFNLDPRIPAIKVGPGLNDAYFGFSVAQHRTRSVHGRGEPVLLVGAPLDQNLQPNTNRSGALYRCPALSSDLEVSVRECALVRQSQGRLGDCSPKPGPPAKSGFPGGHRGRVRV